MTNMPRNGVIHRKTKASKIKQDDIDLAPAQKLLRHLRPFKHEVGRAGRATKNYIPVTGMTRRPSFDRSA